MGVFRWSTQCSLKWVSPTLSDLGLGSHTVHSPGGKCWKDFPLAISHEMSTARSYNGFAVVPRTYMSTLGMELARQFRLASFPDQASFLWVMRRCAHMPFPDDCVAAMLVRDAMSAVSLSRASWSGTPLYLAIRDTDESQ